MNNFTHKLYILTEQNDVYRQHIESHQLEDLEITEDRAQASILLAAPPMAAKCLDQFPNLEWLQSAFAGVDALIAPHMRQDYELTNVKGIFGQQIAEYVLGYMISHYRHFPTYQGQQQQQQWQQHFYQSLDSKVMLILGTGSIGAHLSNVAASFGLKIIGINSTGIPAKNGVFHETYHINELQSAMQQADVVVNTLPNTPRTKGLLNKITLGYCKNALLFNVGRGAILVEEELIPSIEAGHIQHAFLDVFISEPLAAEHPFWLHSGITVTPHIAALSFPHQVVDIFAHNFRLWRDGFQLENRIDFEKGY
ncbi:D-2-hydroxyacid dehydrogenase [Vibrio ziniensis]|uniref:D-2-hydroxyacid dehydrogenase n=1 Tax=Vibrio ziniensis TaxID=2711221 RepID=A0A6G7CLH8_9VIBR|nr:D-2-hydroxyacid dehydrogenase [Vibrio ziniensis]QIH42959.1 D-2-hydroxyacid dehydrogenase [Vibrio ziniensis]